MIKLPTDRVQKEIVLPEGQKIVLLDYGPNQNAKMNLFCVDDCFCVVWTAESVDGTPYLDVELNGCKLTAYSFGGWLADIDCSSGKALHKVYVK